MKNYLSALILFLFSAGLIPSSFGQGSLTPPGPPAPTMKTLDQVEARAPIDATNTPGDADAEFLISRPGSYYLTSNLNVTKTAGIVVNQPGVTIDLNGFEIRRTAGTGGVGISIPSAATCKVVNGSIVGFSVGVNAPAEGCSFEGLKLSFNTFLGLLAGPSATIHRCDAVRNAAGGIVAGAGSRITDCTAHLNGGAGIGAAAAGIIDRCSARENGSDGIVAGDGSTVLRSISNSNGGASGSASGIVGGVRVQITDCTANNNRGNGISARRQSVVTSNRAGGNGAAPGEHAGIRTVDAGGSAGTRGSKVDSNYVENNTGVGILAGTSDFVTRNTAVNNDPGDGLGVANYSPSSGTFFAPIQAPNSATNPFANFSQL